MLIRLTYWGVVFLLALLTALRVSVLTTSPSPEPPKFEPLDVHKNFHKRINFAQEKAMRKNSVDPVLPGMHNPRLDIFQQSSSDQLREVQKGSDSQTKGNVIGRRDDEVGKVDWWSLLNKFEHEKNTKKTKHDDSKPRSDFVWKLLSIRDELMVIANSTRTTSTTKQQYAPPSSWRSYLARTPPDQPIEFYTPILPPPTRVFNVAVDNSISAPGIRGSNIVILVLSHQGSFIKRQAIRETWARNSSSHVLFVVAQSECAEFEQDMSSAGSDDFGKSLQFPDVIYIDEEKDANKQGAFRRRLGMVHDSSNGTLPNASAPSCEEIDHNFLRLEQQRYQDLLEIPMKEHYDRLPEKLLQAYHWVLLSLPHIEWIVKSDDDMFVRINSIESYLKKYNPNIPMVIGEIIYRSPVSRRGKWAEFDYPHDYYPMWPKGSAGHVISKAVAKFISEMSASLHRYQGEDTSIGIWLDEAQKNGSLDEVTYVQAKSMFESNGMDFCNQRQYMMIGHDFSPDELLECYNKDKSTLQVGSPASGKTVWKDDPEDYSGDSNWKRGSSFGYRGTF